MAEQERQVDLGALTDEEVHALVRSAWDSAGVLDIPTPGAEPVMPALDTSVQAKAKYLAACATYESARKLHEAAHTKKVAISTTIWAHVWKARGQAELVRKWRTGAIPREVLRFMDVAFPGLRRKLMRGGGHAL